MRTSFGGRGYYSAYHRKFLFLILKPGPHSKDSHVFGLGMRPGHRLLKSDDGDAQEFLQTIFQVDQGALLLGFPSPFATDFSLDFHSKTLAHKPGP